MWKVITIKLFDDWFDSLEEDKDRENILAILLVLQKKGPLLTRPYADTVYSSSYSNMKECW